MRTAAKSQGCPWLGVPRVGVGESLGLGGGL